MIFCGRQNDVLDNIQRSAWRCIPDRELEPLVQSSPARILETRYRGLYTYLFIFHQVFVGWIREHILGAVNTRLEILHSRSHVKDRKRYLRASLKELTKYFLQRFLLALCKHQKHDVRSDKLKTVAHRLLGKNRAKGIRRALGFPSESVALLSESFSSWMLQFISPGSLCCVDETIFPHYGKKAKDLGLLQQIPGKPFDYGMISYLLVQRLFLSELPVTIGICSGFSQRGRKPIDAALTLMAPLSSGSPSHFVTKMLIADSLWSAPVHIRTFAQHHISFTVAIKGDNTFLPAELVSIASDGLLPGYSRTFFKEHYVLQITGTQDGCTAVLSNGWYHCSFIVKRPHPIGSYKSSRYLFNNETVDSLVEMFRLDEEWRAEPKSRVIFAGTGWDVLRPQDQQGSRDVLSYAAASKLSKEALAELWCRMEKRPRVPSKWSREHILHALFPPEAHAAEVDVQAATQRKKPRTESGIAARTEEV